MRLSVLLFSRVIFFFHAALFFEVHAWARPSLRALIRGLANQFKYQRRARRNFISFPISRACVGGFNAAKALLPLLPPSGGLYFPFPVRVPCPLNTNRYAPTPDMRVLRCVSSRTSPSSSSSSSSSSLSYFSSSPFVNERVTGSRMRDVHNVVTRRACGIS